ncbi:MAG: hypothetical protein WKF41_16870 [Gaiellaceae bacterium]
MTRGSFDSVAHLTRRVRRAEQRAEMLERLLAKTLRLLALAIKVAAGTDCDPMVLLTVIEEVDRIAEKPAPTGEELAELLRPTNPDVLPNARRTRAS